MEKRSLITVWLLSWVCALVAQEQPDSLEPARPWRAVGEVVLTDALVHLTGRCLMNESFAKTTLHSVRTNLTSRLTWDDNSFLLNHMGHPCQGSIFYNAARSNGMNFWQSLPFTLAGSLVWEIAGETESPSINDLITTTLAGTGLGEVTHRLAGRIIREDERGPRRLMREVSAALINPAEGFNRLVTGRAWKVRRDGRQSVESGHEADSDAPRLMAGVRYLAATDAFQDARMHPFFAFSIDYGQAADGEGHDTPYDFFSGDAALTFGGGQPLVSQLHVTGRLCSTPIVDRKQAFGELGLYQYLGYEDSELNDSSHVSPFPYGEMASVGPGIAFVFPRLSPVLSAEQRFFAKCVGLGVSKSDYYHTDERNYNYGSGYGAAVMSRLVWRRAGMLQLDVNYLRLFTLSDRLGDRGNTRLLSVGLKARACLSRQLSLLVSASRQSRHSHYRQHPSHEASCYELKGALQLTL